MAFTDRDVIDRLREDRNRAVALPLIVVPHDPELCDVCGFAVVDPGRFRHDECDARPVPTGVVEAVVRLRAKRRSR